MTLNGLVVSEEVSAALATGRPVVALESTIISHGLPRPRNLEVALELENELRAAGIVPATVGVVAGVPTVGLSKAQIELLASDPEAQGGVPVAKSAIRELPLAAARRSHAATTVAATAYLAQRAGIRVFATGGIGGVHRGHAELPDESADLRALATTPVTVVSAGVKSVLDVPATLERLETLGVPVVGWRTRKMAGFFVSDIGIDLDWSVQLPGEVAGIMAESDRLGLSSALLVVCPVPEHDQLDPMLHAELLSGALEAAERAGIRGREVTPFLLDHIYRASGGASLEANVAAVRNNVRAAAEIAQAWAELRR